MLQCNLPDWIRNKRTFRLANGCFGPEFFFQYSSTSLSKDPLKRMASQGTDRIQEVILYTILQNQFGTLGVQVLQSKPKERPPHCMRHCLVDLVDSSFSFGAPGIASKDCKMPPWDLGIGVQGSSLISGFGLRRCPVTQVVSIQDAEGAVQAPSAAAASR